MVTSEGRFPETMSCAECRFHGEGRGEAGSLSLFFPYSREKIFSFPYDGPGFHASPVRVFGADLGREADLPSDLAGGFRQKRIDEKGNHPYALGKRPEHGFKPFFLSFKLCELPRRLVIRISVCKRYKLPYAGKRPVKGEFLEIGADMANRLPVGILYFPLAFR